MQRGKRISITFLYSQYSPDQISEYGNFKCSFVGNMNAKIGWKRVFFKESNVIIECLGRLLQSHPTKTASECKIASTIAVNRVELIRKMLLNLLRRRKDLNNGSCISRLQSIRIQTLIGLCTLCALRTPFHLL